MRRCGWLAAAVAFVSVMGMMPPAAAAPGGTTTIGDPALRDCAGIAADTGRGVYWLIGAVPQDSRVSAIDMAGAPVGSVGFDAAISTVESVQVYNGLVYLADTGDVQRSRPAVQILRVDNPQVGVVSPVSSWTLHYPDGPHDAKAFMVSPRGNFWVITFGNPGRLYLGQAPAGGYGDIYLEPMAETPANITDATFVGPTTAVLRSYTGLYVFDMENYVVTAAVEAPRQARGESVTQSLDGLGLQLGSMSDDKLIGADIPTQFADLPAGPSAPPGEPPTPTVSTPEPTPTGTGTPTPSPVPPPPGKTTGISRGKTLIAIGVAAVLSACAGVIAGRERGRRTRRAEH